MTKAMSATVVFAKNKAREQLTIHQVNAVYLESSWQQLVGKAEITLPRNVKVFDKNKVKQIFKRGDVVTIFLGYDGNMIVEFKGYITSVSADVPIKISCEDEMFKLKTIPVNISSAQTSLEELLTTILPGQKMNVLQGVDLGAVRFSKTTVGEVLTKLREQLKLYSYIVPTTTILVSGKVYSDNSTDRIARFDLEKNVVSNNLTYKSTEESTVKVRGYSSLNGQELTFTYGDDNAEKIINWQFETTTKEDLKKAVKRLYEQFKEGGYTGSFVAYGVPSVQHGQKVKITSALYKDREGIYYVDAVKKSFSNQGYRQELSLGNSYGK